jgi:hypothetical protein
LSFYIAGVLLLVAFVFVERAVGDEAILPLRLFRHSVFSVSSILSFIIGMGMFGGIICLPLYMQIIKGFTPTKAGLSMLPLMLGMIVFSMGSGIVISKTGRYKYFPIAGTAILIVALLGLSRVRFDTSYLHLVPLMVLVGAGLGCCMQTLVLATQNSVNPSEMGVATSTATFFRPMGGTFGTAVFLTVFFSGATTRIGDNVHTAAQTPEFQAALRDPANSAFNGFIQSLQSGTGNVSDKLNDTSFLQHLPPVFRDPFLVGFSDAMDRVFLIAALVVVPAFVLSFFLKELKLRTESGLQAPAAQRARVAESIEAESITG